MLKRFLAACKWILLFLSHATSYMLVVNWPWLRSIVAFVLYTCAFHSIGYGLFMTMILRTSCATLAWYQEGVARHQGLMSVVLYKIAEIVAFITISVPFLFGLIELLTFFHSGIPQEVFGVGPSPYDGWFMMYMLPYIVVVYPAALHAWEAEPEIAKVE